MCRAVYIVEDHALMRTVIAEFLERVPDLVVGGRFASAEEFLAAIDVLRSGVVVVDQSLPGLSGVDLVRKLSMRRPDLRCLVYSMHDREPFIRAARDAGACGYVVKGVPAELIRALRQVVAGKTVFADETEPA